MTAAMEHYLAVRRELTLPGQGIGWLDSMRDQAGLRLQEIGFPTLRDENWRYTNIRAIEKQHFRPLAAPADAAVADRLGRHALPGLDAYRIVLVDGNFRESLSSGPPGSGVVLESMAAALGAERPEVRQVLGTCLPEEQHGFIALNTAFVSDGVFLKVPDACVLDKPVEIVFFNTEQGGQLVQPRNLIIAGPNSRVEIIERYVSPSDSGYLTNVVTELVVRDAADVEHTRLQEEGSGAFHVGGFFMRVGSNARVRSNNIALGARLARTDLKVALEAEGAGCVLNGVYLGNGRQHIDNFTHVDHERPACTSEEYYKGVLDDRARAVFHGRVVVHDGAQHTDAQQQNRNLLLSENAEIDTKPQLEIYADDVKCSHGATVGQLDEDALFYLRSRGIDETTARSLLTYAFAADVIGRCGSRAVRTHVEGMLSEKLFGVGRFEDMA